jgi:hypothetical protein
MECCAYDLVDSHQIWRNLVRFGEISSDLVESHQIWRNLVRFGGISSDLAESRQIWWNLTRFGGISSDLAESHEIWYLIQEMRWQFTGILFIEDRSGVSGHIGMVLNR